MELIINFVVGLFSQMIKTVIETLAHNWIVLFLSILFLVCKYQKFKFKACAALK